MNVGVMVVMMVKDWWIKGHESQRSIPEGRAEAVRKQSRIPVGIPIITFAGINEIDAAENRWRGRSRKVRDGS